MLDLEIALSRHRFIHLNDLLLTLFVALCLTIPAQASPWLHLSSIVSHALEIEPVSKDSAAPAGLDQAPAPQNDAEKKSGNSADDPAPAPALAIESLAGIEPAALPLGERLVFRATVEWKGAQVLVGHLELGSFHDENNTTILHARGKGDRFGYTIDQQITAVLDRDSGQPIAYTNVQRGSEHHTKKLDLEDGKITYHRREHCRDPECTDEKHDIAEVEWKGPIPWGTRSKHCGDRDCGIAAHELWVTKKVHEVDEPYVDLLTSIYVARTASFPKDGSPMIIPAVNDDHRWLVEVRQMQQRKLTVTEGTYDAIELSLTPLASDGDNKKRFKGLFGIHGTLRVWIDSVTRKPLLIQGTLPISVLDLKARIELISTGDAESIKLRRASTQKALMDQSAERPR